MDANKLIAPLVLATAVACNSNPGGKEEEVAERRIDMGRIAEDIRDRTKDLTSEAFSALVPNSRVREMAAGFFGRSAFGAGPKTWAAKELAYHGVVHPEVYDAVHGGAYGRVINGSGWTPQLEGLLMQARSVVMNRAKDHLSQPENLMAFYKSKKSIILDELRESLEYSGVNKEKELKALKEWINGLEKAFESTTTPEFDEAHQAYLKAEEALIQERPGFASKFGGVSEQVRIFYEH